MGETAGVEIFFPAKDQNSWRKVIHLPIPAPVQSKLMILILLTKHLTKHRRLRNAARFFYALKAKMGDFDRFSASDVQKLIGFSRYEKRENLTLLISENWVGVGKDGVFYLRGRKFFHKILGLGVAARYAEIPSEALSTKKDWVNFIAACAITAVGRSVKYSTKKIERLRYTACSNSACTSSASLPLANSVIGSRIGLSYSSSSRLRTKAARSGMVTVTPQFFAHTNLLGAEIRMTDDEISRFRSEHGGRYFLNGGVLWEQLPSMVTIYTTKKGKA